MLFQTPLPTIYFKIDRWIVHETNAHVYKYFKSYNILILILSNSSSFINGKPVKKLFVFHFII